LAARNAVTSAESKRLARSRGRAGRFGVRPDRFERLLGVGSQQQPDEAPVGVCDREVGQVLSAHPFDDVRQASARPAGRPPCRLVRERRREDLRRLEQPAGARRHMPGVVRDGQPRMLDRAPPSYGGALWRPIRLFKPRRCSGPSVGDRSWGHVAGRSRVRRIAPGQQKRPFAGLF
jgi:hypothetical protein